MKGGGGMADLIFVGYAGEDLKCGDALVIGAGKTIVRSWLPPDPTVGLGRVELETAKWIDEVKAELGVSSTVDVVSAIRELKERLNDVTTPEDS
jgi:hypothetical protein